MLECSPEDFEIKKEAACALLAKCIIDTYNSSLKDHVITEIIRRRQFRYLLLILDCYEKLQVYCNLCQERKKGSTVKSQAIKMIVRLSKPAKDQAPKIYAQTISKLIKGALRVRRLLELSNNNYNIIDAFPDLQPNFFTATGMSVVNYERWLVLVKTNTIISVKEGEILYNKYKALSKKKRLEGLNAQ
jgi:hypothetical protein